MADRLVAVGLLQVCLLSVAFLWGTYSPAVRLVYAQPGAPLPEVLTAVRAVLQAGLLLLTSIAIPLLSDAQGPALTQRSSKRDASSRCPTLSHILC